MHYRKDIQILRGLAVLFVVLFHLQVPGFKSGFLGVDIFFVISGYLMAVMYNAEAKGEFFGKRASRLLPAYFATILVTILAAAIITKPNDFHHVADQAFFGGIFTSNFGFWLENSYFDRGSFKPLLHLWSLSVEVQFYLLVPLISIIARKHRLGYALIVLLSATLCFLVVRVSPGTAFFMLPFRLWEFLIGFGVAVYLGGRLQSRSLGKTMLCSTALMIILIFPLLQFDGTAFGFVSGHPGLAALLVSLASGTVLALGLPDWAQKNLGSKSLELLGKYSYSLYLAHFPVIVLFLYQPFGGTLLQAPDFPSAIFLLTLIALWSAILFKFIEKPFRHSARAIRFSVTAAVVAFLTIPLAIKAQSYILPKKELLIYKALFDRDEFRCGRFYSWLHRGDISCNLTLDLPPSSRRVLLVGNSHADAIKGEFLSVARARKTAVFFIVQNTPLMKDGRVGLDDLVREATNKKVEAVILHFSPGAVSVQTIERLIQLLAHHHIPVSFLLPIPVWQQSVPKMLIANIADGLPLPLIPSAAHSQWNRDFENAMAHISEPLFRVYRTDLVFCKPVCKMIGDNGRPYYFDDAHLTTTGSEKLKPVIEKVFDDLPR